MPDNFGNENRPVSSFDHPHDNDYTAGVFGRRGGYGRSPGSQLFIAIFLIGAGTLLFLDCIGILPVHNIWDFWPAILIAIGISRLARATASSRLCGIVLVLFGVLFLLLSLHVFAISAWDDSWPLALLLIAFGFIALIKTVESNQAARPRVGFPAQPRAASPAGNFLDENSVFGSVKRRVDTPNFIGGDIHCFFGSIEIDLRYTQIAPPDKPVRIDVNCVFGSTKIRVPETWLVSIHAAAVLGNVEDKTIPGRKTAGIDPATLIITGQSVFSTIELEN